MDEGSNRIVIRRTSPAFSKEQKFGFSLVVGIGFLAVLIGFFYLGSHVTTAFDIEYDGPEVLSLEQRQAQALRELQESDTDEDGFSDYEELYLYRTSPYLADTDGDGISDVLEIEAGTDPNCAGENCAVSATEFNDGSPVDVVAPPGTETLDEANQLLSELTAGVSADDVRQFLLDGGVDPELVRSYSDEEIIVLYQQTIQGLDDSGELNALLESESASE